MPLNLRLPHRLFIVFALVMTLCIVWAGWLGRSALRAALAQSTREQLASVARIIAHEHPELFTPGYGPAQAAELSARVGPELGLRLTLVRPDGHVIADSVGNPAAMDTHLNRPEIEQALHGEVGWRERYSNTVNQAYDYVAVPVIRDGQVAGILRVGRPVGGLYAEIPLLNRRLWILWLAGLVLAALLAALLFRHIIRPAREIGKTVERLAQGDFHERIRAELAPEYARLGHALNRMAAELEGRFREIMRQRNEREAILASMREGVLAIDRDERILMVNRAGETLLGISAITSVGRLVQEVLRHADLQKILARALAGENVAPEECLLRWDGDRLLQIEWVPLRDADDAHAGLLVVLNDVTRLNRLENLRRDFVANVSHELRTPITSIKGFIETLQGGAIDEPENARRFLEIIARQADRLNAIIEDLLALSRIEREAEGPEIDMKRCVLRPLLEAVMQHCTPKSESRQVQLVLDCPAELQVRARERLLEQAIGNLADNAIKYSTPGTTVRIEAARQQNDLLIRVIDQGCGIPAQHLPRLFERFYRVDPARSRELGGTGLGLAIVKHIIQAHGGQVGVKSTPGKGSTFTIYLPAEADLIEAKPQKNQIREAS